MITGGGIAIYGSLRFKVLATSDVRDGTRVEFVIVEVTSGHDTMLFRVASRPPKEHVTREFFDKLRTFLPRYDKVVITDDFNSNMFGRSCPYSKFFYENQQLYLLRLVILNGRNHHINNEGIRPNTWLAFLWSTSRLLLLSISRLMIHLRSR